MKRSYSTLLYTFFSQLLPNLERPFVAPRREFLYIVCSLCSIEMNQAGILVSLTPLPQTNPLACLEGETVVIKVPSTSATQTADLLGIFLTTRQTIPGVANALIYDRAQAAYLDPQDAQELKEFIRHTGPAYCCSYC